MNTEERKLESMGGVVLPDKDLELDNTNRIKEKTIKQKTRVRVICPLCGRRMVYAKILSNQIYSSYSIDFLYLCESKHSRSEVLPIPQRTQKQRCHKCGMEMILENWNKIGLVIRCSNLSCSAGPCHGGYLDGGKAARQGTRDAEALWWKLEKRARCQWEYEQAHKNEA